MKTVIWMTLSMAKEAIAVKKVCFSESFLSLISFVGWLGCFLLISHAEASRPHTLTLLYSGEEQGLLGLHGCGMEQVGGLDRRQTVIQSLRQKHANVLSLHTGNLLEKTDPNGELIAQIAFEALSAMKFDAVCLGPQDLGFPLDSLQALLTNHPEFPLVCANLLVAAPDALLCPPYLVRQVPSGAITGIKVAVVGLLSKAHEPFVNAINSNLALTDPRVALANLKERLVQESDFVVVVFHASREEAEKLAKEIPWLDALIVAQGEQAAFLAESANSDTPMIVGKTAMVTNPAKGEAVGVLEVGFDPNLGVISSGNQRIAVSESLTPDENLSALLSLYEKMAEGEGFDREVIVPFDRAVHITYFHKPGCQKCARAVKLLQKLRERYPQVMIEKKEAKESQQLLEGMGALYDVPQVKRLTTPALFIGEDSFLDELDETRLEAAIRSYLPTGVASRLPQAEARMGHAKSEILSRFHSFGALTVAGAGLLDGVNPCAFATIVFLVSYLSLVGRGRKEILMTGAAFTAAVFGTYLLLGLGTLKFLSYLNQFARVGKAVYLLAAIGTFTLATLSLYDAYQAKQGKVKAITLQLPKSLKLRIHKVIREQTRTSGLIAGALVSGFAISALELVCTGQVYLPTITFVMGVEGMRVHALSYLILYNLMFVVPLIVVFGFVHWGTTSVQLGGVLQRHLMAVKLGTGVLLLGLGVWLLLSII